MYKTDSFISADEIKEIVGISKSKAYSLIQELNSELKEKGYLVPGFSIVMIFMIVKMFLVR